MPKVSIIVNCHNGEKYLHQCLDSIFSQTFEDWEIVFWDNVSSDRSLNIAQSYGHRVRCYTSDSMLSLGHARRLAMQEARGEFIAFLDTDDIWLSQHLEKKILFMESNGYLASYAGIQEINSKGDVIRDLLPEFSSGPQLRNILRQFEVNVPTMMLHRSLVFDHVFLFNPSIYIVEEFELFVRIAVDHDIGVVDEVLAQYRVHDGGLTSSTALIAAQERDGILRTLKSNRPLVYEENRSDFLAAFARSAYYEARAYAENGETARAREIFRSYKYDNAIYFMVYHSFWLPKATWKFFRIDSWKRIPFISYIAKALLAR